jgi:nucleoside-diphosphate-sugar epimerase
MSKSNKETVLVTGGCGFIGSHLVESLVSNGYCVRIVDDLSSGNINNVNHLINQGVELCEGNVCDWNIIDKVTRGCKYIFHQAAIVSVPESIKDPSGTSQVTYGGTIRVLEAASQHNVKRVILASSAAIYGQDPVLPKKESMLPNPITPYGIDKLASELIGQYYARSLRVEFVALRYFNVFGSRQNPNSPYSGVISLFCKHIAQNTPPIIHGDGLQSRDFINVSDVVAANLLVMLHSSVNGKVFNVGTGKSTSLVEIINMLNTLANTNLKPSFQSPRLGDIRHSLADISSLRSLGWEPQVNIIDGLYNLINQNQSRITRSSITPDI